MSNQQRPPREDPNRIHQLVNEEDADEENIASAFLEE